MKLRELLDWNLDRFVVLLSQKLSSFGYKTVWLTTPLGSTSWDGDARSTTAKTKIDLSSVFSVPAGVRAVYCRLLARDSGSAGSTTAFVGLDPADGSYHQLVVWPAGKANDTWADGSGWVACDANGDIYYEVAASGAGTCDVYLFITGYMF